MAIPSALHRADCRFVFRFLAHRPDWQPDNDRQSIQPCGNGGMGDRPPAARPTMPNAAAYATLTCNDATAKRSLTVDPRFDSPMSSGVIKPIPEWREKLPPDCPPRGAGPLTPQLLLRLTTSKSAKNDDFKSHAALGKKCPSGQLCEWSSCSMFLPSIDRSRLQELRRFPNLKAMKYVAIVSVDEKSRHAKVSRSKHVDFWMYKGFDPITSIASYASIDEYGK
jgi:hypothetical protein